MDEALALSLGREALKIAILLASPLLIGALLTGLIVSIFQAVTQVNEATMTFIPKIMVVIIIMIIGGSWMLQITTDYTRDLFISMPEHIR